MLVDNKFIFLCLPRCASTSFHLSCFRNNLTVEHTQIKYDTVFDYDISNIPNIDLVYRIKHIHEQLTDIKAVFGYNYPVISVKRDKYERFISYFNHVIGQLYKMGEIELYNKFKNVTTDELMDYKKETVISKVMIERHIPKFLKKLGVDYYNPKLNELLMPIFAPLSYYHTNDSNIISFDFENLIELERWVSKTSGINFKLENFGSSKEYCSNIVNDDNFKQKYESIYSTYETFKKQNTII